MATKGKSGFGNSVVTLIITLVIAGGVLGWLKVNNITTVDGVYDYFKSLSDKTREDCGAENLDWRCKGDGTVEPPDGNNPKGTTPKPSGKNNQPKTSNPKNGEAPKPPESNSVLPLDSNKDNFKAALNKLKVSEPKKVNYVRSEWKHWSGTPCDTRRQVLERDGKDVKLNKSNGRCTVTSGSWTDRYHKDKTVYTDQMKIDIDHVIPLSYAAQHGGQAWPKAKKEAFANDKSQLLAVSASENRSKGDKGPADYMPSNKSFECTYSKIWISTATKYNLTITDKDKKALDSGLILC